MPSQRRRPKSILRLKVSGPHIKPGPVKTLDPMFGSTENFFAGLTIEQLTRAQGVDAGFDLRTLKDAWPDEGDIDTFIAAAEQGRPE